MRYKKPYRYKRKKRLFKKRYFWPSLLFLLMAGIVIYFLFFSHFFQIKNINLSGEEKIPREEILSLIEGNLGNIWLINAGDLRSKLLREFPRLAGVELERGFPSTLDVTIKERVARAVWCGKQCFLMDNQGVIFEEFASEYSLLIIVKIKGALAEEQLGEKVIEQDLLATILSIQTNLKEKINLEIKEALVVSSNRLNLKTGESWQIYFNLSEEIEWQIQKLSLVLEKEISPQKRESLEYIDLRFTRVYYK